VTFLAQAKKVTGARCHTAQNK